jgi:hypothetical protein
MFAKFTNLFHKNDEATNDNGQPLSPAQALQQQIDETQRQLAETQRKLQEAQEQLKNTHSENGSPNSNEYAMGDNSDMEQFLEKRRKQREAEGFKPTPLFQRGISGHQVLVTRNACGTMDADKSVSHSSMTPTPHRMFRGESEREPRYRRSESSSNRNLNHSDSSRSLSLNHRSVSQRLLLSENNNVDNNNNNDDMTHRSVRSNSSFRSQKSTTSLLGEKPDFIPRDWVKPEDTNGINDFCEDYLQSPCAPAREHNCSRETSPERITNVGQNQNQQTKRLVRSQSPEQDFNWRDGERTGFLVRQQSMRKPIENKYEREGHHIKRGLSMSRGKSERELGLQRTVTQGSILGEAPNSILGCGQEASKRSILGEIEPVGNDGLMSKPNSFRRQSSNPNLERTTTQGSILGCGFAAEEKLKASKSSILGNANDATTPENRFDGKNNIDNDGFEKVERNSRGSQQKPLLRFRRTDTPLPQESSTSLTKGHVSLLTSPTTSGHPSLLNSSPSVANQPAGQTKNNNIQLTRTNSRSGMIGGRMQRGTSSRSLLGSARAATNGDLTPPNMSSYSHSQSPMGHGKLPYSHTIHEHCESPSMQMPPGLISPPGLGVHARSVSPPGLVRNDSKQNQSGVEKTLSLNDLLRQTSENRKSLKNMASGPDGSVGFRLRRTNTNLSCVSAA